MRSPFHNATSTSPSRFGLWVALLLCLATWAVSHGYQGLFHDARLYTLQALAHAHPESLSQDVFLKFGSQDSFTVFSPVYTTAMRELGIDHAAAALTLLFQIGVIVGAWALARGVLSASMVLPGVAALIALPGDYGADRVFNCMESFLTPRMAAEALVLAGLAAACKRRPILAVGCVVVAALMHPVMAAAGAAALLCLYVVFPHPQRAALMGLTGLGALFIWAHAMPVGRWGTFDDLWFELIRNRSPFLFPSTWQLNDWSGLALSIATLLLASRVLPNAQARRLAASVAVTTVGGIALTLIACDLLHLVLFTQAQPWRSAWLGTAVAALLLPATLGALWGGEIAARCGAALLLAAWIFGSGAFGLEAVAAAMVAFALLHRLKPSEARWIFYGSIGLLVISIVWRLATNFEFTEATNLEPTLPLWLRRLTSFAHDGSGPLTLIALVCALAHRARAFPIIALIGAATMGLCAALLPYTWRNWSQTEYPPSLVARFSVLREHIPRGSDVFWPDLPLASWILLDRPSYISIVQTSGMVFSRPSALELKRRADALSATIPSAQFLNWSLGYPDTRLSGSQQTQICNSGAIEFLVTPAKLGMEPEASVPSLTGPDSKRIRLYRCPML